MDLLVLLKHQCEHNKKWFWCDPSNIPHQLGSLPKQLKKETMPNANNWHWIERNCLSWAQSHLKNRLGSVAAEGYKVSSVSSVTGQADINQRKGKLLTVYDLSIVLEWSGPAGASGTITLPEVEHDQDLQNDLEVQVSGSSAKAVADVKKHLVPSVKMVLETFAQEMIHENSKDLLQESTSSTSSTPSASPAATPSRNPASATPSPSMSSSPLPTLLSSSTAKGQKPKTNPVNIESDFASWTPHDLYDALVNPTKIRVWSRDAAATVEAKENAVFLLFGGNVSGRFVELTPSSKIVQTWRLKSWSTHSTMVTILLTEIEGGTRLELKQTSVPADEVDVVKRNWESYYFAPIRAAMGQLAGIPSITPEGNYYDTFEDQVGKSDGFFNQDFIVKTATVVVVVAVTLFYSLKWDQN
ncbi:activator of Hsp90 ATPase [Chytriomyces sp. MP71]|nr:activator of Hsp90 ATPase [Chytriomyces sp. MP71]